MCGWYEIHEPFVGSQPSDAALPQIAVVCGVRGRHLSAEHFCPTVLRPDCSGRGRCWNVVRLSGRNGSVV